VANAIEGEGMSQPREQSDTCFHFPLENVIDIVERNQISTLKWFNTMRKILLFYSQFNR